MFIICRRPTVAPASRNLYLAALFARNLLFARFPTDRPLYFYNDTARRFSLDFLIMFLFNFVMCVLSIELSIKLSIDLLLLLTTVLLLLSPDLTVPPTVPSRLPRQATSPAHSSSPWQRTTTPFDLSRSLLVVDCALEAFAEVFFVEAEVVKGFLVLGSSGGQWISVAACFAIADVGVQELQHQIEEV